MRAAAVTGVRGTGVRGLKLSGECPGGSGAPSELRAQNLDATGAVGQIVAPQDRESFLTERTSAGPVVPAFRTFRYDRGGVMQGSIAFLKVNNKTTLRIFADEQILHGDASSAALRAGTARGRARGKLSSKN